MKKILIILIGIIMLCGVDTFAGWLPNFGYAQSLKVKKLSYDSFNVVVASGGVSIIPSGILNTLISTGSLINVNMTAVPTISTVGFSAGSYIVLTSTQEITISSAPSNTKLISTPTLTTQFRPGVYIGFIFDGSYWVCVSSINNGRTN
jgi:hypothetical protein